ncbi:MAG: S24/S26 family peptidase [Bacteroidaceae bacterium]|nr:S24/S26 family peptidase [Bacteroidaceae bacterium]
MTDEIIIKEAARLVADGVSVTFPVKGRSMLPFITGGTDSVILQKPDNLRKGHVVLAKVGPDRYVVHRIIKIDPESGRITLMGDGNIRGTESCTVADVLGLATHVVSPDGRKRSLDSRSHTAKARVWFWLMPVRRWLLAALRRINRKKYT